MQKYNTSYELAEHKMIMINYSASKCISSTETEGLSNAEKLIRDLCWQMH